MFALRLIASRVARELNRFPFRPMLIFGTCGILAVWLFSERAWVGLFTSLVGLVASGGIVWAVRLIGTAALRREAMGFGDVTLMMMVGTFIGWQASLIAFFLAPFAGLIIGIAQFVLRRDDVIPYGPFLCLATAGVIIAWAPIWMWAERMFGMGSLVPAVLVVCLGMLGVMLAIWRIIKTALFGWSPE
jgi:prepilin signal peptidase PulO-like enzyme (type II secretory pathway)